MTGYDQPAAAGIFLFFLLALVFGVLMTVPIGGADMPVVISLYNALTGLAVAFEGFVLGNAGHDDCRYRGRISGYAADAADGKSHEPSLSNVLFSDFGETSGGEAEARTESVMKQIDASMPP